MSLTISIRFLTGRAHLHPWQTHHSEGRVEWPPSPWRLLRALVAIAGRGLISLPYPDFIVDPGKKPKPTNKNPNPVWPLNNYCALPDDWHGEELDELSLSRLIQLLHALSSSPTIWLPKTSGGHTRQYFPIHEGGIVKNSGSAVFDTFAAIRRDQPLLFHWPEVQLDEQQQADLKLLLGRMTYFGRAESWCRAEAHTCPLEEIKAEGLSQIVPGQTHWECVCLESHGKPAGKEYRDYLLERRLAPAEMLQAEVAELLPRTKISDGEKNRRGTEAESFNAILQTESPNRLLLRCMLRESGQDIKDGLERPIGTHWVHYAVPRAIYDVPRPKSRPRLRIAEAVDLVRYALNTATVYRPVLPPLTDTLLVADRVRSAVLASHREPSAKLSGHKESVRDEHAYFWPTDEDNDGFIDHVTVYCRKGFRRSEIDALRRLVRIRQRSGRPDLLVTPIYVGEEHKFGPWRSQDTQGSDVTTRVFVSATPYFCPVHLTHGRSGYGRIRPITAEIVKGLMIHGEIRSETEVKGIQEIVFDYTPDDLSRTVPAISRIEESMPPRQFFPVIEAPSEYPPIPKDQILAVRRFCGASLKDPNSGFPFGLSIGLLTNDGTRFIRALSFCRQRRNHKLKGFGRMFRIEFAESRAPRPFAIGDQCHFGLGLFAPATDAQVPKTQPRSR